MPAKLERSSRKGNLRVKDDLHVKINEAGPAASPSAPGEGGRYVYGIVRSKGAMNFGSIGIGGAGEQVYTVNYVDIAAVVSKTGVAIFDPTRENALAHEHVIETVMKNHTIIEILFRELDEVVHGFRRLCFEQLDGEISHRRFKFCECCSAHLFHSFDGDFS